VSIGEIREDEPVELEEGSEIGIGGQAFAVPSTISLRVLSMAAAVMASDFIRSDSSHSARARESRQGLVEEGLVDRRRRVELAADLLDEADVLEGPTFSEPWNIRFSRRYARPSWPASRGWSRPRIRRRP